MPILRAVVFPLVLLACLGLDARQANPTGLHAPTKIPHELGFNANFNGEWVGALEYRDYSAKSPDAPHTRLPTTLTMTPSPDGRAINFAYVYDDGVRKDGTHKIVTERNILAFTGDTALLTGTSSAENQVFQVAGAAAFARQGFGTLVLTGPGKENDQPADFRITITLSPGEFGWVKETRVQATDPYVFRDAYHFTRKQP